VGDDSVAGVLAQAEELGLSYANLGLFEVNGTYRSKRYAVHHLRKAMTEGVAWLSLPSGLNPADGPISTNPFGDPARGYRDGVVRMDPASARLNPFDSDGAGLLLIGQYAGELADHCVRALLARELDRLSSLGFDLYGAFELEGAVLAETPESLRTKRPADVAVVPGFDRVYSYVDQSGHAAFIDDLLSCCGQMGLPLDTAHAEFTHMLEAALAPAIGLRVADNAALYKAAAKLVAARHGACVSFMARRSEAEQGCGAHINVSLRDRNSGETAFYDPDAPDQLSPTLRHFVAGLCRYLPELFLLLAPRLNSYKRLQPGLFTPVNNTWGINNKTVAYRVVNPSAAATRVEVRPAGADVCPHLALLAVSAAGRLGIEQQLDLPEPVTGSGWALKSLPEPDLPLSFEAAIERFAASDLAREVTSDVFVDHFVGDRKWQLDTFSRTVTDWELAMFGNL
jgi:glutamine synthetase